MKKTIFTLLILLCILSGTNAQQEFITEWQVEDNSLLFPGIGSNYTLIWEEVGNATNTDTITNAQSGQQIPLPSNGNYLVKAIAGSGTLTGFKYAEYYQHSTKIVFVRQWGNTQWTDLTEAFSGCYDMDVTATDAPNLTGLTSLEGMFESCSILTGNTYFNTWNTATITNMKRMFSGATIFNQPVGNWNTTNVTDMSFMFTSANAFNQPLNSWNTGNVTNFSFMFLRASEFNQPLNNWNTANATDMKFMFSEALAFDGDVSSWNTAKVTSMESMFASASGFNQTVGNWNTEKVTNMMNMFSNATVFNQDIGNWNTGNVTNMTNMFGSASAFNQPVGNWDVPKVVNMSSMFSNATAFNQDLNQWNTTNVTNMSHMFRGASSFNSPLSNWNTTNTTDMSYMFSNAVAFNQPIGAWRLNKILNLSNMFNGATLFNQDISTWNTGTARYMTGMFNNATSFNQPIGEWNVGRVWDLANVLTNATAFNQSLADWYIESIIFNTSIGLSNSGMDCSNYSQTLNSWANVVGIRYSLVLQANGLTYNTTGQAARNTLISSKQWTINGDVYDANCGTTVPVSLVSFDISKNDQAVILQWKTAVENNNKGFYVERGSNGDNFEELYFVPAKGSNSAYSYTDTKPLEGKNYYRLKQADINGAATYHEIKSIDFTRKAKEVSLYPNPVSGGLLNILHSQNAVIVIVNSAGQTVKRISTNGTVTQVNVSSLPAGLYFAVVNGKGVKFIIQ